MWLTRGGGRRNGERIASQAKATLHPKSRERRLSLAYVVKLDARAGGGASPLGSSGQPLRPPSRYEEGRRWRAHRRQPVIAAPYAGRGRAGQARPRETSRPLATGALDATAAVCSPFTR